MIRENVERLKDQIRDSCRRSGRKKEEIQILAVTKNVPAERIREAASHGIGLIGESRLQEAQDKFQEVHGTFPNVQWHMIGHLQSNKAARTVQIFDCIQSVDSLKLLETIERRASEMNKVQDCLAEIKISEEPTKSGLAPEELPNLLDQSTGLTHVRILGMMTIAPHFEDPQGPRPYFARARELFEKNFPQGRSPHLPPPVLSMGMSGDFTIAIEEGSTMIRIGTAIFAAKR